MNLAIDLYCGLGGWAEGLLAEGWRVVGFDIERHDYGTGVYPGQLVLQDVTTLHGSQFSDASLIVASPPCQAYSYRAMPWSRAKALPPPDNTLFEACFRIQREACESAGRYIPLIVENVRGAIKWVSQPVKWHFGSYYLWGDVPALMPLTLAAQKFNPDGTEHPQGSWFAIADSKERGVQKRPGRNFHAFENGLGSSPSFNGAPHETRGVKVGTACVAGRDGDDTFGWGKESPLRSSSSKSLSRKAASAHIAKIPLPLAQHIARTFKESGD